MKKTAGKMKKYAILTAIFAFAFVLGTGRALAETSQASVQKPIVTNDILTMAGKRASANFSKLSKDLSDIADKIKNRAENMQREGLDVSAEMHLIVQAEADMKQAENILGDIKTGTRTNISLSDLKAKIDSLKNALEEAQGYLAQAIQGLKTKITSSLSAN